MNAIKQQVDLGAYSVDAQAVADAILRRILANASRPGEVKAPGSD